MLREDTKTLDFYVLETLNKLGEWKYPDLKIKPDSRNIFLGSGNADQTGKLFAEKFGGISLGVCNYKSFFNNPLNKDFASINIVNASGGKHGVDMAKFLQEKGFEPNMITCNPEPPAREFLKKENIYLFPSFIEPPTYNISTYSSMIYWLFNENLEQIKKQISEIDVPNLRKYKFIYFMAADKYEIIANMVIRKVAETLEGIGSNGGGYSNAVHGMLMQPNKDRLVFCLNQKNIDEPNIYELDIDSYLGLLLGTNYIIGKNQTQTDTENILRDYKKISEKMHWKFNKVW